MIVLSVATPPLLQLICTVKRLVVGATCLSTCVMASDAILLCLGFPALCLGVNYEELAVTWSCVLDDVLEVGAFCFSRKMKSCHRYPASHRQMLPTKMTKASTWKR